MDKTGGVLTFNNEIRNAHLLKNLGKYSQYTEELNPAIGEYYEIFTRPLVSITKGKSLIEYTHDGKSNYSAKINHNYLNDDIAGHHAYTNDRPAFTNLWTGDYRNYLEYVTAVYGHETVPIQFLNGLLSLNFMDKALELIEPGIVRDIAPVASLAGAVKTNINNFSGTDTKLGLITNQMYAKSLLIGATFNSDRQRTTSYKESLITPSLLTKYGNTEYNLNALPNLILPNHSDGHVVEEYNADVYIFDEFNEIVNLNTTRIADALRKNVDQPFVKVDNSVSTNTYYNPLDVDKKDVYTKYTDKKIDTSRGKYVNVDSIDTDEFQFSDSRSTDTGRMEHVVYEDNGHGALSDIDQQFDQYVSIDDKNSGDAVNKKSLLYKTNEIFKEHKIHTIYGEHAVNLPFGVGDFVNSRDTETTTTDTAKTDVGRSRGRNLKKKNPSGQVNGYDDPFCRVWTYHNQYDRINKLVRPFLDKEGNAMSLREVQNMNIHHRSFIKDGGITDEKLNKDGGQYLADNTVLRKTGYVNITPSSTDQTDKVDISKCMFSIENLAWKDVPDRVENLSKEQRGPHGGRIMWFPPYDINFNENVNANWEGNTFIGRGEKVYTYTNTDRTGSLSFTLLIDHPAVLNDLHNEAGNENLPDYDGNNEEDKVKDMENDILRFFAGCAPLKYIKKKEIPEEIPIIEEDKPKPEYKTIKIYVFYPNNYSGSMIKKEGLSYMASTDKNIWPDEDFTRYLLLGRNTVVPTDGIYFGYEIFKSEDAGITVLDEAFNNEVINSCKKVTPYKGCMGVEGDKKFRYRVDFDLRQDNLLDDSYNDIKSYGLNLDIESVKAEDKANKKDADYSFAELYYAVENFKKGKKQPYDEEGMNYVKDRLSELPTSESTETRLNEICSLFSDSTEIDTITIHGGATSQDLTNSTMLANRRAGALKWYLNTANVKHKNEITVEKPDVQDIKEKNSINTVEPKSARYAVVELKIKISDAQKLSETDANKTQNDEVVKHTKAINLLYDTMLKSSEILTRYTNSGNTSLEDFRIWFDSEDNEHKETFTDDYILENVITENEEFYSIIFDYCQFVYINQNDSIPDGDGIIGFSKNINLSDSIALDGINNEFDHIVVFINDLKEIDDMLEIIQIDNRDIELQQKEVERIKNLINNKSEEIKKKSNTLDSLQEGSQEYINTVNVIQGLIDEKDRLERVDLKQAESDLKTLTKRKEDDEKLLDNKIKSKNKTVDKQIDKLNKELKELKKKIDKVIKKIEKKDEDLQFAEDNLQKYIEKAASGERNQTVNINYWKNQVTKLSNDKKKIENEKDELTKKYDEKTSEKLKLISSEKDLFDNLFMPSVGDTMYLFNKVLSKDEYYDFYDKMFITNTEPFPEEAKDVKFFEEPGNAYKAYINNLISGFEEEEETEPKQKDITFWVMYAIYLLTRWIETEICGFGDKNTDDLDKLFRHAVDVVDEFDIRRFLMYLVAKCRISKHPTSKFNIHAVTDIEDVMFDMDILEKLEETKKFIHNETPTQEDANNALEELNNILNDSATQINKIANERKHSEEAIKTGGSSVTENNEETEEVIENSAANTVLQLDDTVANYHRNGHRYETESEYFSKLEDKDPIIFKYIKDKIKYFDPAFHSMSPEGFNARLTFLQQCTRQGHTIEAQTSGDERAGTAGNLAFGRMPICILRIGDFIYTRIIINSITINYENNGGIQWDLNPEGAGVQPMIAKVSMAITILGGQSLEGPISRLQNAVSFNYYANTGVYDDRADRSRPGPNNDEPKSNGTVTQTVEGNEASVQAGTNTQSSSTKDKYKTQNYYVWSPVNEEGKSMWEEKKVENKK